MSGGGRGGGAVRGGEGRGGGVVSRREGRGGGGPTQAGGLAGEAALAGVAPHLLPSPPWLLLQLLVRLAIAGLLAGLARDFKGGPAHGRHVCRHGGDVHRPGRHVGGDVGAGRRATGVVVVQIVHRGGGGAARQSTAPAGIRAVTAANIAH